MNKNHLQNHRTSASTLFRLLTLLLLPLVVAAGNPKSKPRPSNVLSVSGNTVTEGNDGISYATVTVTLASPSGRNNVSVDYRTADGSATAGSDYDAVSGTLTFAPGQTSKTIHVPIRGDTVGEVTYGVPSSGLGQWGYQTFEHFSVELSNPINGTLGTYGRGATVYIMEDEPILYGSGSWGYEGNDGTTPYTFLLSLSAAADEPVTVDFSTQDSTAFAGIDYVATSGTITFAPGETSKIITVDVIGNTLPELDKVFYVILDRDEVSPGVALLENWLTATILDDDGYVDPYYYDPGIYYDGYDYGGYQYGNWY